MVVTEYDVRGRVNVLITSIQYVKVRFYHFQVRIY